MKPRNRQNERVIDQFSQQAESYGRLTSSMATDRSAAFRELIHASPDDVLLDVCCGTGAQTLDLAAHVRHATGVDLTPAMLDTARGLQISKGLVNVAWISGDAAVLPFAAQQFSLVTCTAALHHLEHPARVLAEMVRVCRAGGRIAVKDVTPGPDVVEAYDAVEKLRDPSHHHALTPIELLDLAQGLRLSEPKVNKSIAANLSLEAILAASFPATCSREDIKALFKQDAEARTNRLGFDATISGGEILVSYPMTTVVWTKLQQAATG